jgi:hypothetical protein
MKTIKHTGQLSALRVRGFVLGAGAALGGILRLDFRRRLAAAGTAAVVVASSLVAAQPAAADTTYPVNVTFDNVQFTMINDGCTYMGGFDCPADHELELYGTIGAYSTAGAVSAANGLPYRLFGKWGQHPCEVYWDAGYGTTCTKEVTVGKYDFTKVFLCAGSYYQTCSTGYSKLNNTIPLQVHAGEQFKVTVAMQDYDALSSNDTACTAHLMFGPYTATELFTKKFVADAQNKLISMGFNGRAECWVAFHVS